MPGRTVSRWVRIYYDGYDISGNSRAIGPLATEFDEAELTALSDAIKGYLPNHCKIGLGTLNGIFDNTATTGLHILASGSANGAKHIVTVAIGDRAEPAQGVPCFNAQANQLGYQSQDDGGAITVTVPFGLPASDDTTLNYPKAWGLVLNANTARTAANSSSGVDHPAAAATTKGGYMIYHVTAGDGTATLSIDDSADNSSFSALSGATSGSINCATPSAGIVALGTTSTVRRYLRWQLALGTATSVSFITSFVRALF